MRPGLYTVDGCAKLNRKRLSRSEYRNKTVVNKRRTVLRGETKKGEDSQLDKEKGPCIPQVASRLILVTLLSTICQQ